MKFISKRVTAVLALALSVPVLIGMSSTSAGAASVQSPSTVVAAVSAAPAKGGGTTCKWISSFGHGCATLYQGTSKYGRPYFKHPVYSASPSYTKATVNVKHCDLDTFNRCKSTSKSQTFDIKSATNKRPRCTIIRGNTDTSLPCMQSGYGYTRKAGSRARTIVTVVLVRNGVTTSTTIYSPILIYGS